jgi:hypothetical protein
LERVFPVYFLAVSDGFEVRRFLGRCMSWNAGNTGEGDQVRTAENVVMPTIAVLKSGADSNEEAAWIGGKVFTKRISGEGHEGYLSTM